MRTPDSSAGQIGAAAVAAAGMAGERGRVPGALTPTPPFSSGIPGRYRVGEPTERIHGGGSGT